MSYQGLFGAFPFTVSESEVCTFRDLTRKRESVFATHDTLMSTQKLQHTGRNLDEFSLTAQLVNITGVSTINMRLRLLDVLLELGEALPLVIGLRYYGLHVLKSYEVVHKQIHFGVTVSAEVKLSLQEYQ